MVDSCMGVQDIPAEGIFLVLLRLPKRDGILTEAAVNSFEVLFLSLFMSMYH
jgi:hypothetical protein